MARKKYHSGIDLQGGDLANAGFEVVTSLPATNNFIGRQVTYQGRSYIWDGSAWKNDSDYLEIGGRNYYSLQGITTTGSFYRKTISVEPNTVYIICTTIPRPSPGLMDCWAESGGTIAESSASNGVSFDAPRVLTADSNGLITVSFRPTYYNDLLNGIYKIWVTKGNKLVDWTPAPEDKANVNHNHDTAYLGKSAQALDSAKLGGQLPSYYEPAFTKNTAFNKAFGTGSSDVARGDHGHSDLHSHSNKAILDSISAAFTTALKSNYDTAYNNSHTHSNKAILDAISASFTTALKASYDGAVSNSHTHSNTTALNNVSGTNTGDETTQRIGNLINSATVKTTPVDADMVGLMDSAASNVLKKLSWANIKASLKTYFDTLYSKLAFYRVKVGSTYITSTTSSDTLEFVAGSNVTITPDSTSKKITIAASGGGSSSQVQVDFNVTNVSDVRHILNKPAENRTVYNRTSTLVDRKFQVNPGTASGSYNEGIRIGNSSQGYSLIALGADETTDTGVNADGNQWHLIKFPSGNIAICQGSDVSTGLSMEKGGDIYWRNTKLNGSGGTTSGLPHVQITLINIERIIKKGSEILFSSELFEYDTPEFDDELLWDNLDGSFSLAAGTRYEVMINIGFLINSVSGLVRINLKNSKGLIKKTGQTFLDGYGCLSMTCLVDGGTSIFFEIEKSNPDMEITLLTQECWFAIHEI